MSSKKTFEVFFGYKIVVSGETIDEVKKAARAMANEMRVTRTRDVSVRETLPERADGRWAVEGGKIVQQPLKAATVADMAAIQAQADDVCNVADSDKNYLYAPELPPGFDGAVVKSKVGRGVWLDVEALTEIARKQQGSLK